mmetsp:Transcript_3614/g.9585  ORF Transcript_3614/g.9585 Transcript_3614/m.9585 type:complete len:84 (+) Transcript_3614:222-473(+)
MRVYPALRVSGALQAGSRWSWQNEIWTRRIRIAQSPSGETMCAQSHVWYVDQTHGSNDIPIKAMPPPFRMCKPQATNHVVSHV